MTIASFSTGAFRGYTPALEALESSFRKAGLGILFHLYDSPLQGRLIRIKNDTTNAIVKSVSIEGDSPAQAVKDVARAVNCDWTQKTKEARNEHDH
jgi:hypothetical protein